MLGSDRAELDQPCRTGSARRSVPSERQKGDRPSIELVKP